MIGQGEKQVGGLLAGAVHDSNHCKIAEQPFARAVVPPLSRRASDPNFIGIAEQCIYSIRKPYFTAPRQGSFC